MTTVVPFVPRAHVDPAAAINAVVAAQGAMWIMVMHTTASAASTGRGCRQTSSSSGARALVPDSKVYVG